MVQILHVKWLCDVFGYDFLRNSFLSIKILKIDEIHSYSVFVWPWKLTLKQIISSFIFESLNFQFWIPEWGHDTLQNWASGRAQCKRFCLAGFLGMEMLMDLLWFTESQKRRLQSSLAGKTFCFILLDDISALIMFATSGGGEKGHRSLGNYPHQFISIGDCSHFHPNWKLFLPRFLKHYSMHSKRKRRISTLLKHRIFFPLESGWKRPGDTCDILLCNLMRYWQPLGCCGDKGGKRAYIEEISQGFGRKEAKWQSN